MPVDPSRQSNGAVHSGDIDLTIFWLCIKRLTKYFSSDCRSIRRILSPIAAATRQRFDRIDIVPMLSNRIVRNSRQFPGAVLAPPCCRFEKYVTAIGEEDGKGGKKNAVRMPRLTAIVS